jgi:hypothetical protein
MIKLSNILTEISLASVEPYATQFVWRDKYLDNEFYECMFEAEGQPIMMTMMWFRRSQLGDSGEWQFAFFVRDNRNIDTARNWTTSAGASAAAGEVNTLRLFKTLGEAIRDFAETHPRIDVIDVTGGDSKTSKELQKSRIYADLLRTNPDLNQFRVEQGATRLFLVRKQQDQPRPDASGIDTPDNPRM